MTETTLTSFPVAAAPTTRFADFGNLFRTWQKRSRGRRQLARMSGHELSDIGLTRIRHERFSSSDFGTILSTV